MPEAFFKHELFSFHIICYEDAGKLWKVSKFPVDRFPWVLNLAYLKKAYLLICLQNLNSFSFAFCKYSTKAELNTLFKGGTNSSFFFAEFDLHFRAKS